MLTVRNLSKVGLDHDSPLWLHGSISYAIRIFENQGFPLDKVEEYKKSKTDALLPNDCFKKIHPNTNRLIRSATCLCELYLYSGDTRSGWARHRPSKVAVKTSVANLSKGLSDTRFDLHLVPVTEYCSLKGVVINETKSNSSEITIDDYLSQFSYKDENYGEEQAVRLMAIRTTGTENDSVDLRGVKMATLRNLEVVSGNLENIIEEVIVSPHAGSWVADQLEEYVEDDFGGKFSIYQSRLNE